MAVGSWKVASIITATGSWKVASPGLLAVGRHEATLVPAALSTKWQLCLVGWSDVGDCVVTIENHPYDVTHLHCVAIRVLPLISDVAAMGRWCDFCVGECATGKCGREGGGRRKEGCCGVSERLPPGM